MWFDRPMRVRAGVGLALLLLAPPAVPALRHAVAAQSSSYEQLQTFSGVLSQIRLNYVDSVTTGDLVRAAIDGMLSSLDPHSFFLSRVDGNRILAYESGQLAGTGLVVSEVDRVLTVQAVIPRSPAARAGISSGDRVLTLNDTSVAGRTAQAVQARLVGEKGEKIRLTFERGSKLEPDSFRITLKNDVIEPRSVAITQMVDPTTGYLQLQGFHFKAAEELSGALRKLKGSGAKQIILDLRGNPGGFVEASVEIASEFFPKDKLIFRTRGRRKQVAQDFTTTRDGAFKDLPLIVLIDEGSASAAEALAGSLQDHDRALIVGRRSFGKALMQRVFEVPPSGDLVWLTIGYVITPSGRVIQRRYKGLNADQYHSFAGRSGAESDTTAIFRTDNGRAVRGGGGIVPDVMLPVSMLPVWWSVAADSGFGAAVADSVAATLNADQSTRSAWMDAAALWRGKLLPPFLDRVRSRLGVRAEPDTSLQERLARILAARVTEVRWGPEALDEFVVRNDAGVRAASGYFARLPELLKAQ